ncbi:MAG: response regulator [Myxococcota bacterium]|nr:response regulator [Myxococcota bacterium]
MAGLQRLWDQAYAWLMDFEIADPTERRRAKTFIPLMGALSASSTLSTLALMLAAPDSPFVDEQLMVVVCSSFSAFVAMMLARAGKMTLAGLVSSCLTPVAFVLAIVSEPSLLAALGWFFGIGSLLASYAMAPRWIFFAWFFGQVCLSVAFRIVGAPEFGVSELWEPTMGMLAILITMASYLHARISEKIFAEQLESARQLELAHKEADNARRQAVRASEAKSTFLASMSHELRTPLNAIIGYSEMLIEDFELDGEDVVADDLGRIKGAGVHLLELINNILDLSKIEAGRMDLFIEAVNIQDIVDDIAATMVTAVAKNNNKLVCKVEPSCGRVATDRTKLRQILLNLLSNSSKFTDDGTLTVTARRVTRDGRRVLEFSVSDTGIGMNPEQLERVFESFEQADKSTTKEYGGTGLGLTLCRNLAQMLEGDIEATSEEGVGSTFTFYIATEHSETSAEVSAELYEAPDVANLAGIRERAEQRDARLLVIDDDPNTHDLLGRTLKREGFTIISALSGEDGIDLLKGGLEVDAILLDILMPEENGWQILHKLKRDALTSDIPVILISVMDEQQRAITLGASDYIQKPFERAHLIESVERLLQERDKSPEQEVEVLIVEDDDNTRDLLQRMLSTEVWSVHTAQDGQRAIEVLGDVEPDIILLDLMMPRMDGFEVLARLRQDTRWSDIPVIIVTAKTLTPAERELLRRGATHVMQKGALEQAQLVAQARQALGLRAA